MSTRDHNATTGRWQKGNTAARKRGIRGLFDSGRLPRAAKSVQRGVALLRRELLGELRRQGCDVDGPMALQKRLLLQAF